MTMDSTRARAASSREADGAAPAVALFHGLSDRTRLAIVRRLAHGESRVADLVAELGLAQSTVSAHMACLRDCGLVAGRPQGRQMFYALARPELLDLLAAAETLLEATGNAVALCPTYSTDSRVQASAAEGNPGSAAEASTAEAGGRPAGPGERQADA